MVRSARQVIAIALERPVHWYVRHAPDRAPRPLAMLDALDRLERYYPRVTRGRIRGGPKVTVDTTDVIQRRIHQFGSWEPTTSAWLRDRLRPGDTFIDIGANVGYFSLLAAHLVGPSGHVLAVEPHPACCERLRADAARAGFSHVTVAPVALGAMTAVATLTVGHAGNVGASSLRDDHLDGDRFDVSVEAAHAVVTADIAQRARVVKIDVEGGEVDVVRGLAPRMADFPADVAFLVEVSPRRAGGTDEAVEILDAFSALGFAAFQIHNGFGMAAFRDRLRRPPDVPVPLAAVPDVEADLLFQRPLTDAPRVTAAEATPLTPD